ncbi:hypothetical protein O1L55_01890 [Streptomyces albulus]|nr:hypothetical protein [Streptomyces noursei]
MIQYLNFLHTTVQFDLADDAVDVFAPIHRFFRHLMGDTPAQQPTFRIAVHGYDPSTDVDAEVWRLPLSVIRRSNAAEFNFDAHVVDRGGRRLYVNRATLLDAPVDARKDDTFHLRLTEGSVVQVLDFVRDLVIRHEEDLGTVVLHASGAHRRRSGDHRRAQGRGQDHHPAVGAASAHLAVLHRRQALLHP